MDEDRIHKLNDEGVTRYGKDGWERRMGAIGRVVTDPNQRHALVSAAVSDADAVGRLDHMGREALLQLAQAGDAEADRVYGEIRRKEREAHWIAKGRISGPSKGVR